MVVILLRDNNFSSLFRTMTFPVFRHPATRSAVLLTAVFMGACDSAPAEVSAAQTGRATPSLSTDEALRQLSGRRVYFAHQSVGGNIMAGLDSLLAGRAGTLKVVKSRDPGAVVGPAIVHFDAGRNGDPASKNADFLRELDARRTRDSGIAMLKYCYVDVDLGTDVQKLFDEYRRTVTDVKARYPDVTVVHVTMPLTSDATGPKNAVKRILGRPTLRDINLLRNRYNELLRKEFGREPIFDLARLESTRPDGTREHATLKGETVYSLVPSYSYDGKHLNTEAQRRIAGELISVLASARVR